jgi:Fungal specific transcription factor domain
MSELEHEAFELRRRLGGQSSWPQQLSTPTASTDSSMHSHLTPRNNNSSTSPAERLPAVSPIPAPDEASEENRPHDPKEPTVAQTIEGSTLQPGLIDELFQRYFQEFHQFLPILERDFPPNEYYRRSKFLFWAIIVTACRNFPKDPTLLDSIGEKVLNLSLMSMRQATLPTIKGFLLLLTWPMPKRTVGGAEVTYAMSGSLIHMAMQIGLHIPTSSQDFSRVKVDLTEVEIAKRAELWGYCIVTYQR